MRRRFGRGRKGKVSIEAKHAPIDAERIFQEVIEAGIVETEGLEAVSDDEIDAVHAVVGVADRGEGKLVVGFAPRHGGDAVLATVAIAKRLVEEGAQVEAFAVAPQWHAAARSRLGAVTSAQQPFSLSAVAHPALGDDRGAVEAEGVPPILDSPGRIAAGLHRASDRALFLRAVVVFEGLAAKHAGAVRGVDAGVELVVLARRVAAIRADGEEIRLEVLEGERSTAPLRADTLATEMDRLEGLLRKRLNDRRVRGSEEGLRAQLAGPLAEVAGVRSAKAWPVGGSDGEVVDFVGVHDDGRPVVAAIRDHLGLAGLGAILDAALALRPALPLLIADAGPPLRIATPRLLLAAKSFDAAVLRVLGSLGIQHATFDIEPRRGRDPVLALREGAAAVARTVADASVPEAEDQTSPAQRSSSRSRGRGRRGGRRPRDSERSEASGGVDGVAEAEGFDEVSLFDLADEPRRSSESREEGGSRRSRRGRGRRRRGRSGAGGEESAEGSAALDAEADSEGAGDGEEQENGRPGGQRRGRSRGRSSARASDVDLDAADDPDDLSESLAPLNEIPGLAGEAEPAYDDEEEEEGEDDLARRRREAELRARERGEEPDAEPEATLSMPRKRAAIAVHADRLSLICGILLARDLRQIEGVWVYTQEDLMTFFRGVATDLRDDTPIYLIGFMASPARDALQAASLYRGRLAWFDHHEWPPEDLGAMAEVIGKENLHVTPGAESSLSEALAVRTRRSRFSDKVVELATGRFSEHDYERWGRLWWNRLGEVSQRIGDRTADISPLLAGRPSDLAKEAADVITPPPPPEVEFVSGRDFRLVHFGGYTLVLVQAPGHLDPHLISRIARERYEAQVSVAMVEGTDLVILGGDEGRGRRSLDLSGMVDQIVSKHDWAIPLSSEDHVARVRIRDVAIHPERFDEMIATIGMGRSILEG